VELEDRLTRGRVTAGGVHHPVPGGMIETAENLRRQYGISRAEQDELALRSHRLALAAQANGTFAEEIVPVPVFSRGEERVIDRDEHPRADTTLERLGALRVLMGDNDPEATVTAGNASGQNDAAAVCIVTHAEKASELGLDAFARPLSWAVAGVAPATMGIGPVPSTRRALERAGLTLADIDLIELNEAFAAQGLAVTRQLGLPDDADHVNPHGGAIALGHPLGMSGARLALTALNALETRGGKRAIATMCIGVGQGIAALIERV
jgi:acetyl-CoA C-acetyltransferase